MRFLADENIRSEVKTFLKSINHEVLDVPKGASDEKVSQLAKETKSILLTHDHHLSDILRYPPEKYHGIIRIRIHPPSAHDMIKALKNLLEQLSQSQFEKRLIVLEEKGFRIR